MSDPIGEKEWSTVSHLIVDVRDDESVPPLSEDYTIIGLVGL